MWLISYLLLVNLLVHSVPDSILGTPIRSKRSTAEKQWFQELRAEDLDPTRWLKAEEQFFVFLSRMSRLFHLAHADLNFALVGACDGLEELTITKFFIPNPHWRAIFVEALLENCQDLESYLKHFQVHLRSLVVHGAVTDVCERDEIVILKPIIDRSNETIPHWVRKEIGGIATKLNHLVHNWHTHTDPLVRDSVKGWNKEKVECIVPKDILRRWSVHVQNNTSASTHHREFMRPHVLKIDAEGNDYEVLSFLVIISTASYLMGNLDHYGFYR